MAGMEDHVKEEHPDLFHCPLGCGLAFVNMKTYYKHKAKNPGCWEEGSLSAAAGAAAATAGDEAQAQDQNMPVP